MLRRRPSRAIAALVAAVGCCALGLVLAVAGRAAATPEQARAEMARTTAHAPKDKANRIPVYAIVRDGDAIRVLRGQTDRHDGSAFARRMHALPSVLAAGVDGPVHAAVVNDPKRSQQWALDAVNFESAWTSSNGTGVKVAVLDTGVRATHEDLTGNIDNGANCLNVTNESSCTSGAGVGGTDVFGHGTHVAGILDAHANNSVGIAGGAYGTHIIPVQVLDNTGEGSFAGVASGILWAADHGAKVISLSLTGDAGSQGLLDAVNYALAHNIVVVAAAGNNFSTGNAKQYPASYPGVLSVGSIQNTNPYSRSTTSNTSSNVGVVAPGQGILSTLYNTNSSYGNMSGTSMATPYVSAAAAILLAVKPTLTPAQIVTALESTATALASPGTGHGLINPVAAIASLTATTTTSTTSTTATTTTIPGSTTTTTSNPNSSTSTSTSTSTTSTTSTSTSTTSTSTSTMTTSTTAPATVLSTSTTTVPVHLPPPNPGYWIAGRDGRVRNFGVSSYGDRAGHTSGPVVALAATKSGHGYWLTTSNGAVYTQGDAVYAGSRAGSRLNAPIIAMARSAAGKGYWLLGADGGIFTYGDAKYYGSTGSKKLNAPIVDFAPTPTGKGYWLLGADGGVFTFGDAKFFGSTGSMRLAAPVVSMSPNPMGGYWLIARDGGVFTFGPNYYGSLVSRGVRKTVARLRVTPAGKGYWILATDGSVYAFGDAPSKGSAEMNPAVDLAVG